MINATCSIADCSKPAAKRSWCGMHYRRWQRHGDPNIKTRAWDDAPPAERWRAKIQVVGSGCWEWQAGKSSNGYGVFHERPNPEAPVASSAHQFVYVVLRGDVPEGCELDHLCRNRICVNPDHLEPVPHVENMLRAAPFRPAPRMVCDRGHEDYALSKSGKRECRTCRRETTREAMARYRSRMKS